MPGQARGGEDWFGTDAAALDIERGLARRAYVLDLSSQHGCNQFQSGDLGDRAGVDSPTVSKDGHLVAELEYLIQVVAHVEKCHAVVTEDSNDTKQLFDLIGLQGRSGFVEDHHLGVGGHGPDDRDHLLDGNADRAKGPPLVHGDAVAAEKTGGIGIHLLDIDQPEPAHWLPTEEQVLCHGHERFEIDLLEGRADAGLPGLAGTGKRKWLSLQPKLALVGAVHAVDQLDESRFPGSVLADQGHEPRLGISRPRPNRGR